jgi:hypothetical protein
MLGSLQLQKIGTSTREQCNIARQVCAGLDFLADKSLVHTFESGVFSTIFEINIGLQECELSACVWVRQQCFQSRRHLAGFSHFFLFTSLINLLFFM